MTTSFSTEEFADMNLIYGKAEKNSTLARRLYQERFPHRRLPDHQTFQNVYRHLREFGTVLNLISDTGRSRRRGDNIEEIITGNTANMTERPKRPLSAYMLWLSENREKIKKDFPGIRVTEIAKKGGEMWRNMKDKTEWEQKAAKMKDEYTKAVKDYEANGGTDTGNKKRSKASKKQPAKKSKKKEESEEDEEEESE